MEEKYFLYDLCSLCLTLLAGLVCDLMHGISNQETSGTFLIHPRDKLSKFIPEEQFQFVRTLLVIFATLVMRDLININ